MRLDKRVIGKTETFKNDILKIMVIDGIETFDQNKIANGFNKFFLLELGLSLHLQFRPLLKDFKQFMNVLETVLQEYTFQEKIRGRL